MRHEVRDDGVAMVVAFSGDVDLDSSRKAREVLLGCINDTKKPVLVDLSDVSYIDSSGIASLVEALQMAKKKNRPFILASISEACMRVMQLARLDKVFSISANVDEAKSSLP